MGLPGMIAAAYLGITHVNHANRSNQIDIVPVDYVCNALIACASDVAVTERR